jgi:hypothetical protein
VQTKAPIPDARVDLAAMATIRRVTARQLAARTGFSYYRVVRIMRLRATPSRQELQTLAAALFDEDPAERHARRTGRSPDMNKPA